LRVLIVDDSVFMRKVISDLISSDPELNVVGTAIDGVDALEKISKLHPDVVTLDVAMPRMDGLTAVRHIMEQCPIPIIMLSSTTSEGAETTLKALEYGAVDYVLKPSGAISLDIHKVRDELVDKIKAAAHARLVRHDHVVGSSIPPLRSSRGKIVLLGASTGGPPAIEDILLELPENSPPVLIVQHMPPGFTRSFAERLDHLCKFRVKEAKEEDLIVQGQALLAAGGYHMTIGRDRRVHLDTGPLVHGVRPSVDPMMETAADVYGSRAIGVLLTGMGRDGASGMEAIKKKGGSTIAQDEATSTIFGMPRAAIEKGVVDKVLPLNKISHVLISEFTSD
jgi:two-component system chemotaxis response regulator CheB